MKMTLMCMGCYLMASGISTGDITHVCLSLQLADKTIPESLICISISTNLDYIVTGILYTLRKPYTIIVWQKRRKLVKPIKEGRETRY